MEYVSKVKEKDNEPNEKINARDLSPSECESQRILYPRLRAYWSRCEHVLWNSIGIGLLYLFEDSLLNLYIDSQQYYYPNFVWTQLLQF